MCEGEPPIPSSKSRAAQPEWAARGGSRAKGGILMLSFKVGEIHGESKNTGKKAQEGLVNRGEL